MNKRDHDLTFDAASVAFEYDPYRVTTEDQVVDGEQRWRTLAMFRGQTLLLISHLEELWGGDLYVRMISARRATKTERTLYGQNNP